MNRGENREIFESFMSRLCDEVGLAKTNQVIQIIIEEMGGLRITIPTIQDLERKERDRKIRALFNGINLTELSLRFGVSSQQIRRILVRED